MLEPVGLAATLRARMEPGALGCCVPSLAAQWCSYPALSWAALIGFWVALYDPGPPRSRLLTIGAFTAGSAAGILTRVLGDAASSIGNLRRLRH